MRYAITNGQGQYLGRVTLTGALTWVGPAHAYAFDEAEADRLARVHGGRVVGAVRWTGNRYEEGAR